LSRWSLNQNPDQSTLKCAVTKAPASFGSGTAAYAVPAGHTLFTATATDPDGNTSEFSECFGIADLVLHADFEACSGFD